MRAYSFFIDLSDSAVNIAEFCFDDDDDDDAAQMPWANRSNTLKLFLRFVAQVRAFGWCIDWWGMEKKRG